MTRSAAKKTASSGNQAAAKTDSPPPPSEGPARVATIVGHRQYSTGEGYEAGQTAPADLYMEFPSGKVVKSEPDRGRILARKGEIVQPHQAQAIADAKARK